MKKVIAVSVLVVSMLVTLVGCGHQQQKDVALADVMAGIKEVMKASMIEAGTPEDSFKDDQIPGMIEVDLTEESEDPLVSLDIDKDALEEGILLTNMISLSADQIIILEAKDESKVEELKAFLEELKEKQLQQWESYLPDQYEKVQNAVLKTNGRYLLYAVFSEPEKIEDVFDTALE